MAQPHTTQRPSSTNLVDLLSSYNSPVQKSLLACLQPGEVATLNMTSTKFFDMDRTLATSLYNINLKLKKFFDNPQGFRSLQGECNAIVVSDFALKFLSRDTLPDGLVIYAPQANAPKLKHWLEDQGYTMAKPNEGNDEDEDNDNDDDEDAEPGDLWWKNVAGKKLTVSLDVLTVPPIQKLLNHASTTANLNFITWNAAYSLFPSSTFITKDAYMLNAMEDTTRGNRVAQEVALLAACGIKTSSSRHQGLTSAMSAFRRIGDKYTWKLPLCTKDISLSSIPVQVLESTTFKLHHMEVGYLPVSALQQHYKISASCISSQVLEYDYVVSKEVEENNGLLQGYSNYMCKIQRLQRHLSDAVHIELMKIPRKDRPRSSRFPHPDFGGIQMVVVEDADFVLPSTWIYRDDEMFPYLKDAWEAELDEKGVVVSESEAEVIYAHEN
ncbi:hypothetical protein P280DRAFT_534850 [Massarina eburnea CBS 473.64]|uniref:Uncharacterized protein n=1 Tax=Massarina eburnea CBS 473.64 TaxID=1395130 RepID=A0A6A6SCG2_9PLEO|nr:hypothetical protein P280DRAFT_534850 [Massarina eburnea CBS 473.64]